MVLCSGEPERHRGLSLLSPPRQRGEPLNSPGLPPALPPMQPSDTSPPSTRAYPPLRSSGPEDGVTPDARSCPERARVDAGLRRSLFVPSGRELRTGGDARIRGRSSQQVRRGLASTTAQFRPYRQRGHGRRGCRRLLDSSRSGSLTRARARRPLGLRLMVTEAPREGEMASANSPRPFRVCAGACGGPSGPRAGAGCSRWRWLGVVGSQPDVGDQSGALSHHLVLVRQRWQVPSARMR